jgi:hypothetical protein
MPPAIGLAQKGVEAAGEAAKGAAEQLFGGQKKEKKRQDKR